MDGGRKQDTEGNNGPYLPERYHQRVHEKQRRRLIQKILIAGSITAIVAVFFLVILGTLPGIPRIVLPDTSSSPAFTPISAPFTQTEPIPSAAHGNLTENITVAATPFIARGSGLQTREEPDLLPLEKAIGLIRLEFPALAYTIASVNLTGQAGRRLYEFTILPGQGKETPDGDHIFIDAANGTPYTPGQESARTTADQATRIAGNAFPTIKPDVIRVRYHNPPDMSPSWDFMIMQENATLITGSLDADTGRIGSFAHKVSPSGRPPVPVLSLPAAQEIANKTIATGNRVIPVSMTSGRYESLEKTNAPVAGRYVFQYNRIVQDIPCDNDGFTIAVDSVTGEILDYERRWADPENAFSIASESLVTKREATFAILQKAKEIAPESISSVQIITAQLRWKDLHAHGIVPRPGSIPLAWKVTFDDDVIRAGRPGMPATGWVDAQTAAVLEMDYRH